MTTQVEIVRPDLTFTEALVQVAGFLAGYAFNIWVAMLLFGVVHHGVSPLVPALGYWQTAAVFMLIKTLFSSDSSYLLWTRSAK